MSPFRALLSARLQLLWNVAHRGKGLAGTLSACVIVVVAAVCLAAPFAMFVRFGEALGEDLSAPGSPALTWLSGLHALLVLGLGAMAGIRHQAGFDRVVLRAFPLAPLQVLAAELPFNLIDTIPVLGWTMFLGLGVGLTRSSGLLVHVVPIVIEGMVSILLVQQLVGAARRIVSRSRTLVIVAALVLAFVASVAFLAADRGIVDAIEAAASWLPTSAGYLALRSALRGQTGQVAFFHAIAAAWLVALFGLTLWMQFKEMDLDPPEQVETRVEERPWTFDKPASGVMRLFVSQVTGARNGILVLVLPLFCSFIFVLTADILRRSAVGRDPVGFHLTVHALFQKAQALPLYALILPLVVLLDREFWLNQFAWHGPGIKTLLVAPLRTADLLRGQLGALLLLQVPQGLIACAPLARLRMPAEWELLTGIAAGVFAAIFFATAGHALSARYPRVLVGKGERTEGMPAALSLLSSALSVGFAVLVYELRTVLFPVAAWLPAVAFAALAGATLLARRVVHTRLVAELDDHRELLAETLG